MFFVVVLWRFLLFSCVCSCAFQEIISKFWILGKDFRRCGLPYYWIWNPPNFPFFFFFFKCSAQKPDKGLAQGLIANEIAEIRQHFTSMLGWSSALFSLECLIKEIFSIYMQRGQKKKKKHNNTTISSAKETVAATEEAVRAIGKYVIESNSGTVAHFSRVAFVRSCFFAFSFIFSGWKMHFL